MRLDKWLWAARWFKTRGLAQLAIASGRVKLHEEKTKPAHALKVGDQLEIRVGESVWQVEVTALSDKRGPAAQARKLYAESEASRAERERRADLRRHSAEPARTIKGRPTKRDRRKLDELKS
ncbi:MAG TPA: RNA-binding S4 domain-containing protein [Burkholderiales bacterium]|nr:RNA-binding S4 domain-containing protein [Burkholderiales bacterium]